MPIYGMALRGIQADHGMLTGMARTGRPKAELTLSDDERATLQRWARRAKSSQALALRANIILTCAQGHTIKKPPQCSGAIRQRPGSGVSGLLTSAWTDWLMSRVRDVSRRSLTSR